MIHIIKTFLSSLFRFFTDKRYRYFILIYQRYGKQRGKNIQGIRFEGGTLSMPDAQSFVWQFKELFVDEIYKFETPSRNPIIIDCGANIGLSCIYFKHRFPEARITAFEADPEIVKVLNQNLRSNNAGDVEVRAKAVWVHNEGIHFKQDGSDGGSITTANEAGILVQTARLKDVLQEHPSIDFLKIDIEGAETEVLNDCKEELYRVQKLFVEYHSYVNQEQSLSTLLTILKNEGFRYSIQSISETPNPFMPSEKSQLNFELQLNIFAWK
ncbi:MAG: FkbM family methyltransferase [Bacteroidota bacterium]